MKTALKNKVAMWLLKQNPSITVGEVGKIINKGIINDNKRSN